MKQAEIDYNDALSKHPNNVELIHIRWEQLQTAIASETDAKKFWMKADSELTTAKNDLKEVNSKLTAVELEINNNKFERDIVDSEIEEQRKDPKQAAADKAEGERVAAVNEEKKKQEAMGEADKTLKLAQKNTSEIEKLGDQAKTSASASASGTGSTTSISDRYGVNKDTVAALSQATQ
uniref:Uncharacterized protein n=1 Tax=Candidatus Nitrotoga fabula TaxID=2182327 RepID=A0A2X0SL11_9PROT|nr:protein of unknown function [Candidatus Nitrotoga fabula]